MILLGLSYTISILCYEKAAMTISMSAFIIYHYILAYLAFFVSRSIDEEEIHQELMSSYIIYQDELLLPSHPQPLRNNHNSSSRSSHTHNNNSNRDQNPYFVNPALEPPPSYNSLLNGRNQHH